MLSRHLRTHLVVAPSTSVGKSIFSTGLVRASLALGERVGYLKPVGTGSGDGDDELHLNKFAKGVKTACLYHFDEPVSPHLAVERSAREGEREGKGNLRVPTDREFVSAVGGYVRGFEQETKGNRSSLYIESAGGVHSPTLNGTSQLDAFRPLLPPTLLIASHQLGGISTTISAYESLSLRGYEVDQVLCFRESYYANHEYFTKWFGKRGIRVGVVEEPPKQDPERDKDEQNLESYYKGIERESELGKVVEDLQRIHVKRIEELETASKRTLDKVWWPFVQHGLVKSEKEVMVIDSAYQDTFSVFTSNSNDTNDNQSTSTPSDDEASSSSSESAAVSPVLPPPPTPTPTSQQPPPPSSSDDNSTPTSTTSPSRSSSSNSNSSSLLLSQVFDGSASWWTQCLGHSHPELVLAASHSMGRFGHVMFPSATNLPALQLAEKLLESVGKGWADRVFFSDNGSTGMEVGLKMALRSFTEREGKGKGASSLGVLGLKGSYHGDTIGAMDACEGGVYSERVEWYQGRGYWLEAPEMRIEEGKVVVRGRGGKELKRYDHLNEVYETDRRVREDPLGEVYRREIERELEERLNKGDGMRFGCLILEPVIMGAGGMIVVDPLYQRILIDTVRTNRKLFPSTPPSLPSASDHTPSSSSSSSSSLTPSATTRTTTPVWKGLPIIFDEVFTGLYRLGKQSASSFLGGSTKPDISCYAKILTGGMVPMSVTLASDAVFRSFYGENKVDALLHGHSYTAHATGCGVANKTLDILRGMESAGEKEWKEAKLDWETTTSTTTTTTTTDSMTTPPVDPIWSLWSHAFVHSLSSHPKIDGTISLGTVLVCHLKSNSTGYTSTASEQFLKNLRYRGGGASGNSLFEGIHARPLGNVVYFMSSLNSKREMLREVEECILKALD